MLNPKLSVALRYGATIIGTVITLLATLGYLTSDQATLFSAQLPKLVEAILTLAGIVSMLWPPIWAVLNKNSAAALVVADKVDAGLPLAKPLVVETPAGMPDLVVTPVVANSPPKPLGA